MARQLVSGNLVYNGDFEIAPPFTAAQTAGNKWIDGTASGSGALSAYGWSIINSAIAATASAQFDSSVAHTGSKSIKLSTADATGAVTVGMYIGTIVPQHFFPLSPNTSYTLEGWIKTDNVATNSAFFDLREYTSGVSAITTNSSTKLSGTNDWTKITLTFTTQATTALGGIFLRNNVTGNVGSAWFDDIVVHKTTPINRTIA